MENWEDYKDAFEPFETLVEIEILGRTASVPENNTLLRCFQFLSLQTISYGDFCWNGDCANCQIWLADSAAGKPVLACRTKVQAGMEILKLSDELKFED